LILSSSRPLDRETDGSYLKVALAVSSNVLHQCY
jgi:hypothetical protein